MFPEDKHGRTFQLVHGPILFLGRLKKTMKRTRTGMKLERGGCNQSSELRSRETCFLSEDATTLATARDEDILEGAQGPITLTPAWPWLSA